MSWGAVGGAVVGLVGNSMMSDENGGAGASQSKSEPWAPAQPWLMQNLLLGQGMQGDYLANPISAKQQAATDNQYALSDYARGLVPSLMSQMQAQPLGYDKSNPATRPQAFDWGSLMSGALGQQSVGAAQDQFTKPVVEQPDFINQLDILTGQNHTGTYSGAAQRGGGRLTGVGGYGEFRYGMEPDAGSQAYRDMSEYFARGGGDPNGLYSQTPYALGQPKKGLFGSNGGLLQGGWGAADGGNGSVGGSPGSDGSGGGSPGGNW